MLSLISKLFKKPTNHIYSENNSPSVVKSTEKSFLKQEQAEIIEFLNQTNSKIVAVEAPTGTGKTVAYLYYAYKHWPGKVIISSYTKALQDQIVAEIEKFFPRMDFVVIKGKGNYICKDKLVLLDEKERTLLETVRPPLEVLNKVKVTSGYCRPQYRCKHKPFCEYMKLMEEVQKKRIVIVNHFLMVSTLKKFPENTLLIVDECHHLNKVLQRTVEINEEDFEELPPEPVPEQFSSVQEFNKAVEDYLEKKSKKELIEQLNAEEPGEYILEVDLEKEFENVRRVLYVSATLPDDFQVLPEDVFRVDEKRSWADVEIHIENTDYRQPDYKTILKNTIRKAMSKYDKVLILATNFSLLKDIKKTFPDIVTQIEKSPFQIAEMLNNNEIKAAAGCDTFWTGINIPGKKCIIMTKLPFPSIDKDLEYEESVNRMVTTLRQGFGRMLRSSKCSGEIYLLDRRAVNYPQVVEMLDDLKKKGAKINIKCQVQKSYGDNRIVNFPEQKSAVN